MKTKDLLKLLKTNYLVVSDEANEYNVNYLKKDEVGPEILEAEVASIEPVTFLRKQLFVDNAEEGDYVGAIKFLYRLSDSDSVRPEPEKESYQQNQQEQKRSNPFPGFGSIPPLFSGADLFGNLLTPEVIEQITKSDLFQTMMDPENIKEIINSDDFKDFMKNADFGKYAQGMDFLRDLQSGMQNASFENDSDSDDYEEYDEYDDFDDYDDDEYDEI